MQEYRTGLEGKGGDARLIVDCPVMGAIGIEWCGECAYSQGREALAGGKRRPDKEGVICGAPLWRPARKIVLALEKSKRTPEKPEKTPGKPEKILSFGSPVSPWLPWRWKFWRK